MKSRVLFLILIVTSLYSCRNTSSKYIYNQGYIYGTQYHIVYESPHGKDLHEEIKLKLGEYNRVFSTFDTTSVISKVNNNQPVELNAYFLNCFNRSMEISEITDGAFDITAGPMVNAWGFGPESRKKVTPEIIDSLKEITGFRKIQVQEGKIIKENPGMKLDMSAIAKGYTCDLLGHYLSEIGCENYMVEIGGEVTAKGKNEKGNVWTIGISKPEEHAFFASSNIHAKVRLPDNSLATSGNYRNFYEEDGKKYAHTIDPKTGYPVQHSLLSATVLTGNCMDADAYATAFMVMGLEKSIEISRKIPALKVYFIYADEEGTLQVYMSDDFKAHLIE